MGLKVVLYYCSSAYPVHSHRGYKSVLLPDLRHHLTFITHRYCKLNKKQRRSEFIWFLRMAQPWAIGVKCFESLSLWSTHYDPKIGTQVLRSKQCPMHCDPNIFLRMAQPWAICEKHMIKICNLRQFVNVTYTNIIHS